MELNGALWNPELRGRLANLAVLREQLVAREPSGEAASRCLRRRQGAVLESVTAIVEQAGVPMRVREVHAAVEQLFGEGCPVFCERGSYRLTLLGVSGGSGCAQWHLRDAAFAQPRTKGRINGDASAQKPPTGQGERVSADQLPCSLPETERAREPTGRLPTTGI
jgi:hypothetical protein